MAEPTDLSGKTILITGANSGIGEATARGLAAMGAHILMVARNREKGEAARAGIIERSGNKRVDLLLADLGKLDDIRALAEQVMAKDIGLDVLINNAAIVPLTRELTKDGLERQFAVNHLAYLRLTLLLLNLLKASAPSRIINLSSILHTSGNLDFDNLQSEKSYGPAGLQTYNNTKLYNVLFTYELARRIAGSGVTVNAVHPGFLGTNLSRTMPKPLHAVYKAILAGPDRGAKPVIYLASSPEVEEVSGTYFDRLEAKPSSAITYDEALARRLWEVSMARSGLQESEGIAE
ncbi:MAG: SDR family oxidoreductase [Chloroflexi bacterium]|nr:SDR family oxidoreductase [Chloroflexota bacterium]